MSPSIAEPLATDPVTGRFAALGRRALAFAEARLPALTRYRRAEPLPIRLHPRRIYVLPTGFGVLFGVMLLVMLLGALNFNNNAALLLTFLLAGIAVLSMGRGVATLARVRLEHVHAEPVHAGDELIVELALASDGDDERRAISLTVAQRTLDFEFDATGTRVRIALPTTRRGWHPVGAITLACSYPFGMFRAWSVLRPDLSLLVYPRPEGGPAPRPPSGGTEHAARADPAGDEWFALREYRRGDARRLIAWRPSARADRLLVKEMARSAGGFVDVAWDATAALEREARIERLARWTVDADRSQKPWRLTAPGVVLGPKSGAGHRHASLKALAELP